MRFQLANLFKLTNNQQAFFRFISVSCHTLFTFAYTDFIILWFLAITKFFYQQCPCQLAIRGSICWLHLIWDSVPWLSPRNDWLFPAILFQHLRLAYHYSSCADLPSTSFDYQSLSFVLTSLSRLFLFQPSCPPIIF